MAKASKLVILVILVVLNFLGATGNGTSLHFTTPVLGKLPGAAIPKLTLGFEIALRGELEIEKEPDQPHDVNDLAKMIEDLLLNSAQGKQEITDELNSNSTVVIENEASVVGDDNGKPDSNAKVIKDEASVVGDDNGKPDSNAKVIKDEAPVVGDDIGKPDSNVTAIKDEASVVGDDKYIEQGKQEITNEPDFTAKAIEDETSVIGDEKCAKQGNFCTSIGPFCCKPLLCINFVLVGVGICEDLRS